VDKLFQARKKVPCFCKCEINSIYKVTSMRIVEIEEAHPPLEEIWVESVSFRRDRGDRGDSGTPGHAYFSKYI
jgi:hypothetical protein